MTTPVTYASYSATTAIGGRLAAAVGQLLAGIGNMQDAVSTVQAITGINDDGTCTTPNNLVGGDVGAATNADAANLAAALFTINYCLNNAIAGGMLKSLAALDKGGAS